MICLENVKKFCRDDISKIENYQEAVNSPEKWDCHHRLELTLDGEFAHTYKDLKRMDMYYSRPYFELIFLKHSEHASLHKKGEKNPNFGKKFSGEHKQRLSESHKGKTHSEETKQRMRENHGGGVTQHSEESKQRISASKKGMKYQHSEAYWAKKRALKNTGVNPDLSLF